MNTNPKKQPPRPQPQSLDELIGIREELIELRKELKLFRQGLMNQIASGVALALIVFAILSAVLNSMFR